MSKKEVLNKNISLFKWFEFFLDFSLYYPIAVLYFAKVTGSYTLGLAVFSIVYVASAIFEIPTGIFSDLIGRKKTIILGSIAGVFAISSYALANSFLVLALGAFFEGLSRSFYSGNNTALLYDTLRQKNKLNEFSDILGKLGAIAASGLAISALIGGFVAVYSLRLVVSISILPRILCLLISFGFVEPKFHSKEKSGNIFQHLSEAFKMFKNNAKLRTLSLSSAIRWGVGEASHEFKPAFVILLWPTWALGITRMLDSICSMIGFNFAGRIIKKMTALKLLVSQEILSRINYITFLIFPSIISPIMHSLNSLFFGLRTVANSTLLHKEFTNKQRATMDSLNSLVGSLVFALFSLIIGIVADKFGPIKALLVSEIVLIPLIYVYYNLFKKHNHEKCLKDL